MMEGGKTKKRAASQQAADPFCEMWQRVDQAVSAVLDHTTLCRAGARLARTADQIRAELGDLMLYQDNSLSIGRTPLIKLNRRHRRRAGHGSGQDRRPESGLLGEGSHRRLHDLGRGKARRSRTRQGTDRAHQRQYRNRAGLRRGGARLPHHADYARDHVHRAAQGAARVRRESDPDRRLRAE